MPQPPDTTAPQKPPSPDTTRNHLANERTLLAWARTGLAVMALGFVVARFGLALREVNPGQAIYRPTGLATPFGMLLIVGGVALLLVAGLRYLAIGRAIERQEFHWSPNTGIALVGMLALIGVVLIVYLMLTA